MRQSVALACRLSRECPHEAVRTPVAQPLRNEKSSNNRLLINGRMARISKRSLAYSAIASYSCVCVALLLLVALTIWASYRDLQFVRSTLLRAEVDRVRSHAQRTAGRIEQDLEVRNAQDFADLDRDEWLQRHWQRVIPYEERRSYGAVVSRDGEILLHSDPSRNGKRLPRNWYTRVLSAVGDDVVETYSPNLALGERAYDVRTPIEVHGREVGEYHAGFDISWFDRLIGESESSFVRRRLLFIGSVLLIVLLASTSLFYIASHSISLRRAVNSASLERATEVGKLAGGLAHEIRNPLQAIRINLHALRNVHKQKAAIRVARRRIANCVYPSHVALRLEWPGTAPSCSAARICSITSGYSVSKCPAW